MKFKRTLKLIVCGLLAVACMLSMFACGNDNSQAAEDGKLPIQWINKVYYFQQGVRTDWKFTKVSADKKMVDRTTGLVCQLAPVENAAELTEEEIDAIEKNPGSDTRTAVANVEYCVYYFDGSEGITMTTSTADVVSWLQDETSNFYFNNKHNLGDPRDTYMQTSEPVVFYAQYSKLQFQSITYTFTRDGEDWKGVYNLVMNGKQYFIVTYEAKADLYEKYNDAYLEIIGDFRKEGWETA